MNPDIAQLIEALVYFVRHDVGCGWWIGARAGKPRAADCTCGMLETVKAAQQAAGA